MKITPTLLSLIALPLGCLWIPAGVAYALQSPLGFAEHSSDYYLPVFFVGGPIAMFLAAMLITIRRRERTPFHTIDKIALGITAIGAFLYLIGLLLGLLTIVRSHLAS